MIAHGEDPAATYHQAQVRLRPTLGVLSVALLSTAASAMTWGAGVAAALPPECFKTPGNPTVTCTYTATGEHALQIPTGVNVLQVSAVGGAGARARGFDSDIPGGAGGTASGNVPVTGGTTLYIQVGGNGQYVGDIESGGRSTGGYNGGGEGGDGGGYGERRGQGVITLTGYGGGGGGASDVRTAPAATPGSLDTRLLVAPGGGGAGGYGSRSKEDGGPGGAGDQTAPGGGQAGAGPLGVGTNGEQGRHCFVDDPACASGGGGGGGGGLRGGEGGMAGAGEPTQSGGRGGGGGSFLVPAGGTAGPATSGPQVVITYQAVTCIGSVCGPDFS